MPAMPPTDTNSVWFFLTRTNFIREGLPVCPKEGTRVRVLGLYHNMAWYGAVGHWGSGGRGSGVVIGERRSGLRQVAPEWVRGTRQAGRTTPAGWIQQGRSRRSICVCCTTPTVRSPLLTPVRPLGSFSGDSRPPCPRGDVPVADARLRPPPAQEKLQHPTPNPVYRQHTHRV